MYTFIAAAGLKHRAAQAGQSVAGLLQVAGHRVIRQLPKFETPLVVSTVEMAEIEGGWVTIQPERETTPRLLSEFDDAEHSVLVFGQIDRGDDAARMARDAFVTDGVQAVSELPGVFSALIVSRRTAVLHVVTSVPGCRSLHYLARERTLLLSPTDLGLVALSEDEVNVDLKAAATIVACGWGLSGACALAGVRECQPYEIVSYSTCGTSVQRFNPLTDGARLSPGNKALVAQKRDEVIEELRCGVQHQLRYFGEDKLTVALTAGVDSRAGLSLMLSLLGRDKLETYTKGGLSTEDVRVAQRVARRLNLTHHVLPEDKVTLDGFTTHARYLAAVTNGSSNAEAAVWVSLAPPRAPRLGGGGGEVFRGYYYNYLRRSMRPVAGVTGVAEALLASPLERMRLCSFGDPTLGEAAQGALVSALGALEHLSADPYDLADLFYIVERMGRWGSSIWRRSLGPSFVPFANSRAMRALFQLPAPVGDHAILATAIRKYAPASVYWMPVNGAELLALEGPGSLRYLSRELLRAGSKVTRRVRQRYLPRERSLGQARGQLFGRELHSFMRDTLTSSGSLARELFTTQSLEERLTRQNVKFDQMSVLGMLLSLELWREQVQAVAQQRRSDPEA